jgi:hypothetical protein
MSKTALKFLFSVLLFTFLFFVPNAIFASWQISEIDNYDFWRTTDPDELEAYLQHPSIDLYQQTYPHIAYFAGTSLKYAFYDGSSWQKRTLVAGTAASRTGASPSLKIDSENKIAHISYFDVANRDVRYLAYDFIDNVIEGHISLDANAEGFTSLALRPDGNPGISFFDFDRSAVKYAEKNNSIWSQYAVESGFLDGAITSLAIDDQDNIYLAYVEKISATQSQIRYAENITTWQTYTVATTGWISAADEDWRSPGLSLALDSNQKPHIVYNTLSSSGVGELLDVRYASKSGASWSSQDLFLNGFIFPFGLTFNQDNQPHFFYSKGGDLINNVFSHTYYDGTDWLTEELDDDGNLVGFGAAGISDSEGNLHSAYLSLNSSLTKLTLRYAASDDLVPEITVSPTGSIFSQKKNITLTANEIADIYYTTNSETPTTASEKYSTPIKITKPTTLKFFAKDLAGNESEVQTINYIITPTTALYQANRLLNYYKGRARIYTNKRNFKKSFYPFGKKYKGLPLFFAIGNTDGKGNGEILAASRSKVKVLKKSGKKKYAIKTPVYRVKVADLNLNGREETLVQWKNKIKVYNKKKKVAVLKLKYDWVKDFVVARKKPQKPRLVVTTWDGKIRIYTYKKKKFKLKKRKKIMDFIYFHAIDTNNDGKEEFVLKRADGVYILSPSFKTIYKIAESGIVTVGDINNDNKLEILVNNGEKLLVFRRQGQVFKKINSYSYYLPGLVLAGKM